MKKQVYKDISNSRNKEGTHQKILPWHCKVMESNPKAQILSQPYVTLRCKASALSSGTACLKGVHLGQMWEVWLCCIKTNRLEVTEGAEPSQGRWVNALIITLPRVLRNNVGCTQQGKNGQENLHLKGMLHGLWSSLRQGALSLPPMTELGIWCVFSNE